MSESPIPVGYETPTPRSGSRGFAGAMLIVGGLGLILLGGCFTLGILMTIQHTSFSGPPQQLPMTPTEVGFAVLLAILALGSIGGGAALIVYGARALLRIAGGDAK